MFTNSCYDELLMDIYNTRSDKDPYPDSIFRVADGHEVQVKVHRCLWSNDYPENSLAAIEECLRVQVACAEIDISMLQDSDFLVAHHGVDFGHGPTNTMGV